RDESNALAQQVADNLALRQLGHRIRAHYPKGTPSLLIDPRGFAPADVRVDINDRRDRRPQPRCFLAIIHAEGVGGGGRAGSVRWCSAWECHRAMIPVGKSCPESPQGAEVPSNPSAQAEMEWRKRRVALAHDWLVGYRGGEAVLEAIAR